MGADIKEQQGLIEELSTLREIASRNTDPNNTDYTLGIYQSIGTVIISPAFIQISSWLTTFRLQRVSRLPLFSVAVTKTVRRCCGEDKNIHTTIR